MNKNQNCDGAHCSQPHGIIKKLPLGGGANLLLCRSCFDNEMRYRKQRALDTKAPENWKILNWEDLEIYNPYD